MTNSQDYELAYKLHQEINSLGVTENATLSDDSNIKNYKPKTLIDRTLELIDPNPNIHTLFVQFNERFFWNVLLPVEVKWSNRMTSCAGICSFHPRNRQCIIALSAPLLKLRPRKDLVETLLHEMIHGYLFLTNNNRDRDGHGPEFCKHMNRINMSAGTNITIYHSFHDEVRLYQQHWWRCNGPCQKRAPYFGTVRRAMNRAPGSSDFWWKDHQQSCGGTFIKIKEPDNYKSKVNKNKVQPIISTTSKNNIYNWVSKPTSIPNKIRGIEHKPSTNAKTSNSFFNTHKVLSTPTKIDVVKNTPKSTQNVKKLGNGVNNVHGWGTGGPNMLHDIKTNTATSTTPKFCYSATLGGSNSGQSNLLNKYSTKNNRNSIDIKNEKLKSNTLVSWISTEKTDKSKKESKLSKEISLDIVKCPICGCSISTNNINTHIDDCLIKEDVNKLNIIKNENKSNLPLNVELTYFSTKKRKMSADSPEKQLKLDESVLNLTECPICNTFFQSEFINDHVDKCLVNTNDKDGNSIIEISDSSFNESNFDLCSSPSNCKSDEKMKSTKHKCLICNSDISIGTTLTDHLEDCIGNLFRDDTIESANIDDTETETIPIQNDKYPCPVCMKLTSKEVMNEHLDACLKNS